MGIGQICPGEIASVRLAELGFESKTLLGKSIDVLKSDKKEFLI